MRLEIKELQRKLGVTSLYVTHDQVEAMTLADRMIVMHDGVAEQIGAPLEVYANPQTAFVAGFIGSPPINFVDAALLNMTVDAGAQIGIRPEHIVVTQNAGQILSGTLLYAEPLGAETLLHMRLANGQTITVRQDGGDRIPEIGEEITVGWDPASQLIFGANGQRV